MSSMDLRSLPSGTTVLYMTPKSSPVFLIKFCQRLSEKHGEPPIKTVPKVGGWSCRWRGRVTGSGMGCGGWREVLRQSTASVEVRRRGIRKCAWEKSSCSLCGGGQLVWKLYSRWSREGVGQRFALRQWHGG